MARLGDSNYQKRSAPSRPGRHAKSPNKRKKGATQKKYRGQGRV
jgi:hypothetical protein